MFCPLVHLGGLTSCFVPATHNNNKHAPVVVVCARCVALHLWYDHVLFCAIAQLINHRISAWRPNPEANPKAVLIHGNARFTILTRCAEHCAPARNPPHPRTHAHASIYTARRLLFSTHQCTHTHMPHTASSFSFLSAFLLSPL